MHQKLIGSCGSRWKKSQKERPFVKGYRLLAARQEAVAREDRLGDVGDLPIGPSGLVAKQVEGLLLVERLTLHQDPLGPLGDGSSSERSLERVVLGETLQRDIDRALHLLQISCVGDVGEDPETSRPVDERSILYVEDRDDRAGRLTDDRADELEGLVGLLSDDDEGDVGQRRDGHSADGSEVCSLADDLVTERGDRHRDLSQAFRHTVDDENPKFPSRTDHPRPRPRDPPIPASYASA